MPIFFYRNCRTSPIPQLLFRKRTLKKNNLPLNSHNPSSLFSIQEHHRSKSACPSNMHLKEKFPKTVKWRWLFGRCKKTFEGPDLGQSLLAQRPLLPRRLTLSLPCTLASWNSQRCVCNQETSVGGDIMAASKTSLFSNIIRHCLPKQYCIRITQPLNLQQEHGWASSQTKRLLPSPKRLNKKETRSTITTMVDEKSVKRRQRWHKREEN